MAPSLYTVEEREGLAPTALFICLGDPSIERWRPLSPYLYMDGGLSRLPLPLPLYIDQIISYLLYLAADRISI